MFVGFDSTNLAEIPISAPVVAGYVGGDWPTYDALLHAWPHARHISIAISPSENADCLDIENGDAQPQDAPLWWARQSHRGIHRPILYSDLANLGAVLRRMDGAGIPRSLYRIWTAHYTGTPHICEHDCFQLAGISSKATADGTQWTDFALARDLDESLFDSQFFTGEDLGIPGRDWYPADEARWIHQYDKLHLRPTLYAKVRTEALRRAMRRRIHAIEQAAKITGWDRDNRLNRYHALHARI